LRGPKGRGNLKTPEKPRKRVAFLNALSVSLNGTCHTQVPFFCLRKCLEGSWNRGLMSLVPLCRIAIVVFLPP